MGLKLFKAQFWSKNNRRKNRNTCHSHGLILGWACTWQFTVYYENLVSVIELLLGLKQRTFETQGIHLFLFTEHPTLNC